ncbi:MAG: response regulator, partial [Ignavibacteria bacterium]|nr:response regulator [Ignavibacteria bacterium]MCU7525167.1 response regulator [Ignavibacteria bacterium]
MEQQTDRIRILVVDDSDVIRHALKTFFEDYNLEVLTCTDGLEGLQKAAEFKPNLIFLDLMMPNFDGLKMLQVIKVLDNLRHIPIIVISANTDRRNVLAAVEAGAERVLSKPLQKEMIIKYVNEILGSETLSKSKKKKIIS